MFSPCTYFLRSPAGRGQQGLRAPAPLPAGGQPPRGMRSRKELSTMAIKVGPDIKPGDVGLKREIGLIGATWASETSIIGSGWLLGSFAAAQLIGGASVIAWLIGAVAIIILALVHAELGGMYPVAGGTARFPHLAFGEGAGISFGFFSWLQAVTAAPIECYAIERDSQYRLHNPHNHNYDPLTGQPTPPALIIT